MRKLDLSRLGGAFAVALLTSALIVVTPLTADAASRPTVESLKLAPSSIGGLGGKVTVTAKVKLASSCVFSISPHVSGLPTTKKCSSGTASVAIILPANPTTSSRVFTLKLTVTGAGGSASATKKIVEAPKPLTDVATVVGQQGSYCALLTSGRVDCWGENSYGQLGNGTTRQSYKPTAVKGAGGIGLLTGVAQVAGGTFGYGTDYCAVLVSGGVDCWGWNLYGQLGNGTTAPMSRVPTKVKAVGGSGTLTGVTQVAVESDGFCARLGSGGADCWGLNDDGELGDGTYTGPGTCNGGGEVCSTTPVAVVGVGGSGTLSGVTSLVGEASTMCAILTTHDVDCWGYGGNDQIGGGTPGDSDAPATVKVVGGSGLLTGVTELTSDDNGTNICARLSSGGVDCWGEDTFGELGDGETGIFHDSDVAVAVKGVGGKGTLSGVGGVVGVPGLSNCAVLKSGGVDCWGYNGDGVLANGSDNLTSDVPTKVVGIGGRGFLGRVSALTSGNNSQSGANLCARFATGVVACWGEASSGFSAVPKDVPGVGGQGTLTARSVVSDEGGSNCALLASGEVACWGNEAGVLGDGSANGSVVPEVVVATS